MIVRRVVESLLALGLITMVVMVFGNVVLRYGFSSGITVSEEASRVVFVWITFGGAILAYAHGGHIAMEKALSRLPGAAGRCVAVFSQILVLGCCALMVVGGWHQALINWSNYSPVSGIPRGALYAASLVAGVAMGALTLRNLWRLLRGDADAQDVAQQASAE